MSNTVLYVFIETEDLNWSLEGQAILRAGAKGYSNAYRMVDEDEEAIGGMLLSKIELEDDEILEICSRNEDGVMTLDSGKVVNIQNAVK